MFRRSLLGTVMGALGVVSFAAGTVNAGGWAVVTVESLPEAFEVGTPARLVFAVRQHGVSLTPGLRPTVQAVLDREIVHATSTPGEGVGRYEARLDLPRAGEWTITIDSGFGTNSRLTLLPIAAVQRGAGSARTRETGPAERGRQLFVAKGCVTCHSNARIVERDDRNRPGAGAAEIPAGLPRQDSRQSRNDAATPGRRAAHAEPEPPAEGDRFAGGVHQRGHGDGEPLAALCLSRR